MDLEGLEDDPDFWQQMEYNPSEEEASVPVIDLTGMSVSPIVQVYRLHQSNANLPQGSQVSWQCQPEV